MFKYRIGLTCPNCGEDIISDGYCMDYTTDDVVMLDAFTHQSFECENCGATVYTNDADSMCDYEGGEDYEEDGESE